MNVRFFSTYIMFPVECVIGLSISIFTILYPSQSSVTYNSAETTIISISLLSLLALSNLLLYAILINIESYHHLILYFLHVLSFQLILFALFFPILRNESLFYKLPTGRYAVLARIFLIILTLLYAFKNFGKLNSLVLITGFFVMIFLATSVDTSTIYTIIFLTILTTISNSAVKRTKLSLNHISLALCFLLSISVIFFAFIAFLYPDEPYSILLFLINFLYTPLFLCLNYKLEKERKHSQLNNSNK